MSKINLGSAWYRTMSLVYNNLVSTRYAQKDLRSIGYKKYDDEGNPDDQVTLDEILSYCDNHGIPKGNERLALVSEFFRIAGTDSTVSPYDAHQEAKRLDAAFESIFTLRGTTCEMFAFCNKPSLTSALMSLKLYRVDHAIVVGNDMLFNYRDQSITSGSETYYLPSQKARDLLEDSIKGLVRNINNFNVIPCNKSPVTKNKRVDTAPLDAFEKTLFKQRLVGFLNRFLNQ